jgi:SAM-dependent methyltransferase
MKDMWDDRYSGDEYFYGTEPNKLLQTITGLLPTHANILCIGEGEGRNAVYLARLGHNVTAIDYSIEGKRKAEKLARQYNIEISYLQCPLEDFNFSEHKWDAVISIFCHLPITICGQIHQKIESSLKTNGLFICQAYSTEQLDFNTGGPKDPSMLYSESLLRGDFSKLIWIKLEKITSEILEGKGHTGLSSVVNAIGFKREL